MKRLILTVLLMPLLSVAISAQNPKCNSALLKHVYHSTRLVVKNQCIAVTGTIVDATAKQKRHRPDGVRHEPDGDTHGWLKPDAQFKKLLNQGNTKFEDGNLVFEIICRFSISQKDAIAPCKGGQSNMTIPPVGSHVRIVGQYVQETNHGKWMEIHPVTSIALVP